MTAPIHRCGGARFFAPHNPTEEQRALTRKRVWRVAWLGSSLFDHEPQIRQFDNYPDADAFADDLTDVVWCVTDEVSALAADVWPPAVGDYALVGDAWPWELLDLADLNREAVGR